MTSSAEINLGALGQAATQNGEYNRLNFVISQLISRLHTITIARVESCTNDGGLSPVGSVDVTPIVNQIDGAGNAIPHVTLYNVPYFRIQGGKNAAIIDPEPGDIGLLLCAERDISKVKTTRSQGNPGSWRQYDLSDAIYIGGILNGTPLQYVRFSPSGVEIVSPQAITLTAPQINVNGPITQTGGDVTMSGNLTVSGDATASGTSLHHHKHTTTTQGSPTSEPL